MRKTNTSQFAASTTPRKASTNRVMKVARIAAVTATLEMMVLLDQVGRKVKTILATDIILASERKETVMQGEEVQMHMRSYQRRRMEAQKRNQHRTLDCFSLKRSCTIIAILRLIMRLGTELGGVGACFWRPDFEATI
jgi:hypothetical protein